MKIIKLVMIVVIIGVLYFLLFNNVYFVDINILYINIIIIEKIKKISGIKNNKSREIKVVSIIILLNNNFSLLLSDKKKKIIYTFAKVFKHLKLFSIGVLLI